MIIGVTGGIGAGKSTVSKEFENLGAFVIDADEISRRQTEKGEECYSEIVRTFGEEILLETGEINRKFLAKIVFSDEKQLEILNKITHKFVKNHIKRLISQNSDKIIVLDVPLLFSPDFDVKCDATVAVLADIDKRLERVKLRSNMTEEEFYSRVKNQPSDAVLKEKTTYQIVNNDLDEMKKQVREIFDKIKETD